jgi:ParB family chromosome partitioning protein
MVKEVTPVEILSLALVENIQREDLNALEAAVAYRQLIDEFGLTQAEVARQVGKSRSTVANTVRLANLPLPVKDALMSRKIDEGHARALLGLPDEDTQVRALERVLAGGLSVRETESLVRAWLAESSDRESQVEQNPEDGATEDMLRTSLGTKVSLIRRGDRGRLVIHFYSRDQLSAVVDLLTTESSPNGEEYFEAG